MANNKPLPDGKELATKTALFLAEKLNAIGVRTEIVSQQHAQDELENHSDISEFSVADIQKLDYEWNGESISLKVFAQTFGELIKQKDRTLEDVDRIAKAYIESVKGNPSAFVPQLKPENMSHWRYFVLPDESIYTPSHLMANSPEYSTQKGLWEIYNRVLGDDLDSFVDMIRRRDTLSASEREAFLEMERTVSGSDLMQRTLENNAVKVNEQRNRDVQNLIQYFDNNSDYTYAEKALILKGSMTYSYSEKKKDGGRNEVKLVRITDANDVAIPVLGGEAASIVDGLRKGLNFKDSLILARSEMDDSRKRSVGRDFTGWKRYEKSDREEDIVILNKDAAGTGWCTGGSVSTARTHLSEGDFHIYFEHGEPLIAIRTQDGRLAEAPRGAHDGQFCTPREEAIAFDYISEGHGIIGGRNYIADMLDLRKLNNPASSWRDIITIPRNRRYENGEYGGDTQSWGEAAERRIKQILQDSKEERFAIGYYTPLEIVEYNIPPERVIGLLNDEPFRVMRNL